MSDPLADGLGHAARQAAELAALLAMAAEAAIRAREHHLRSAATDAARDRAAWDTERAAARLVWSASSRPEFASATGPDAARVWAGGLPEGWCDPTAAEAARRAEARLAEVAPDLLDGYQRRVASGADPADVIYATSAAALGVSGNEPAAAAVAATPDNASTRRDDAHRRRCRQPGPRRAGGPRRGPRRCPRRPGLPAAGESRPPGLPAAGGRHFGDHAAGASAEAGPVSSWGA